MHARRGGRGRPRGRTYNGEGAGAVDVAERPSVPAAAEATLAVQHAADEDELLRVAHTHLDVLRPGVLAQALLRIAKVCELRGYVVYVSGLPQPLVRCSLKSNRVRVQLYSSTSTTQVSYLVY